MEASASFYGGLASLAQMVEHLLCKLKVLGSMPKGGRVFYRDLLDPYKKYSSSSGSRVRHEYSQPRV